MTTATSLDLTGARQRKGISLDQIVQTTKISQRFLVAIENEEFEKLPGGVFNTSYIRQYAACIGYEPKQLLDYYFERFGQSAA